MDIISSFFLLSFSPFPLLSPCCAPRFPRILPFNRTDNLFPFPFKPPSPAHIPQYLTFPPPHPPIYPSTYCFPPTGSIARLQRRSPPNSTTSFPQVTPPPHLFRRISNLFSRTRPATIEYTLCILHTRRAQCNAYPPPQWPWVRQIKISEHFASIFFFCRWKNSQKGNEEIRGTH